jgi:predicted amidophosphoribosyltransferase
LHADLLVRTKYTETQVWKTLVERSNVTEKGFEVLDVENMEHKHFLLIDDVLTTGSTLEACSRALLKIPGVKISVVCMAMAHS